MAGTGVEHVVSDRERPVVDRERTQVVQLVLAVVPPDQDLQQRLVGRDPVLEPAGEEADDSLGYRGQRLHPLRAIGRVRIRGECLDRPTHPREHGGALLLHHRLVEPAEPHAAREVADRREADLRGEREPVEHLAGRQIGVRVRRRLGVPALQDGGDDGELRGRALLARNIRKTAPSSWGCDPAR